MDHSTPCEGAGDAAHRFLHAIALDTGAGPERIEVSLEAQAGMNDLVAVEQALASHRVAAPIEFVWLAGCRAPGWSVLTLTARGCAGGAVVRQRYAWRASDD